MPDRRMTLAEQIEAAMRLASTAADQAARQLRDRFEAAGLTVTAPPEDAAARSVGRAAALILGELRGEAEMLVDGVSDDQSDRAVIVEALRILSRVGSVVVHELGLGWRKTIRPFTTPGNPDPITLADAVEYLAADRAQWKREALAERTEAAEAKDAAVLARVDASKARRQVAEIRTRLDRVLRPEATRLADCDDCAEIAEGVEARCEWHSDVTPEPPLSDDLAAEVDRLVTRMYEAQSRERSAARGRVSVYVDGRLVSGPNVFRVEDLTEPELRQSRLTWDAAEVVHYRLMSTPAGEPALTACDLITDDYATTGETGDVTCPRCLRALAMGAQP